MKQKQILFIIVCLSIGFVAGMEFKKYQLRKILTDGLDSIQQAVAQLPYTANSDAQPYTANSDVQPEKTVFIQKSKNEVIQMRSIKYRINSSYETDVLTPQVGSPVFPNPGTKFVVVNLTITNVLNAPFTFFPGDGFSLLDNQHRQFRIYENTMFSIDNYLEARDLAPGVEETGNLVYELPTDSISYSLLVLKAGTNEVYSVALP